MFHVIVICFCSVSGWHIRLGHIDQHRMECLTKSVLLHNIPWVELSTCVSYLAQKSTNKLLGKAPRDKIPFQLACFDACGHLSGMSQHNAWYFITFIHVYTHYVFVYLIFHKLETISYFLSFSILVKNQLHWKFKILRIDRGRVYLSTKLYDLLNRKGILHQLTLPYTLIKMVLQRDIIKPSLRWTDRWWHRLNCRFLFWDTI